MPKTGGQCGSGWVIDDRIRRRVTCFVEYLDPEMASRYLSMSAAFPYPHTPDGRYFVVRGRLWRLSNPSLDPALRQHWVDALMRARREVRAASANAQRLAKARESVDQAKRALGERGPVWWQDGTPDYNRFKVRNSPYAEWYLALTQMDS
jgi:hypothetical protein